MPSVSEPPSVTGRWHGWPRPVTPVIALLLVMGPASARAAEAPSGEATYGRIAGDVSVVAGVGVVATSSGARGEGELRARYLDTAGLFASYEDGGAVGSGALPTRVVSAGLELRPLFLIRWLRGMEWRHATADMTLDSLGLELGATLSQRASRTPFSDGGFQVSAGVEMPLAAAATGPWIGVHGGFRWAPIQGAGRPDGAGGAGDAFVALTLAWHHVLALHLVDFGDQAPR